jgi:hypothetical protein
MILKFIKKWETYYVDTTTIALPEIKILTSKCDIDLLATDLGLIFKFIKKWQTLSGHDHHCSTRDYDWLRFVTLKQLPWVLFTTRRLHVFDMSARLFKI